MAGCHYVLEYLSLCSLASYDLVITTYNIVGLEGASCEDDDGVSVCVGVCEGV